MTGLPSPSSPPLLISLLLGWTWWSL
uniref:Uncharacterized protein n=1 Tax=Vitis vinifera TaxID=29760 RepID=F6H0C3_VITVI